MTVDDIVAEILKAEGGFVDDPDDRGGATNYGVSLRYARSIDLDLDGDGDTDADDIRKVNRDLAKYLFLQDFLYHPHIDMLPDRIIPTTFDMAVNSGPKRAVQFVQQAINELGFGPIDKDGICGPLTIRKAHLADAICGDEFLSYIVDARVAFYMRLAEQPSQAKFLQGWLKRAEKFRPRELTA